MKHLSIATIFIATLTGFTGALAQNVFRCGSSYSQTPCPDGVPIEARDARSKAQATQNMQSTERDAKTAQVLEQSRLKEEALASRMPSANKSIKPSHSKTTQSKTKATKKKEPEYFSARVISEQTKKGKDIEKSGSTAK